MEKMKVLAVAKDVRDFNRKNGEKVSVRRVIFARNGDNIEGQKWNGYVPSMFTRRFNGESYKVNYVEIEVQCFKNGYVPAPGDFVTIECDFNGNIVSVTKVAA